MTKTFEEFLEEESNKLKEKIRGYSTKKIVEMIKAIGGKRVDIDKTTVRAALLDVYEEREGDKVDDLMKEIGLM